LLCTIGISLNIRSHRALRKAMERDRDVADMETAVYEATSYKLARAHPISPSSFNKNKDIDILQPRTKLKTDHHHHDDDDDDDDDNGKQAYVGTSDDDARRKDNIVQVPGKTIPLVQVPMVPPVRPYKTVVQVPRTPAVVQVPGTTIPVVRAPVVAPAQIHS